MEKALFLSWKWSFGSLKIVCTCADFFEYWYSSGRRPKDRNIPRIFAESAATFGRLQQMILLAMHLTMPHHQL
jgi:hypothetical protein